MQLVITMVPGTWGRNSPWLMSDSRLSKVLRNQFGQELTIRNFDWTCRNSHTARKRASSDLRDQLRAQFKEFPSAKHFLICHSHGGNVALYALQDSELRTQVAGVVCMATPFLVATQTYVGRSYLGLNYENYNIFPSFIPLIALTALLAMALMVFYNWPTYFAFIAVFFFLVIMSPLWFVVIEYVADKYDHFSFKISQEMELPSLEQHKMLILRSPGDEASVTLAFAQFLCWLVLQIFAIIKVIVECLSRMLRGWSQSIVLMGLILVITVVLEIFLGVFRLIHPNDLGIYWRWDLILILQIAVALVFAATYGLLRHTEIFIGCVFAPIATLVWPMMILVGLLRVLPLGWEVGVASIPLDVTTETTPPGSWTVHQLKLSPWEDLEGAFMWINLKQRPPEEKFSLWQRHSVYEKPEAVELICRWIAAS